ncbi:AMP-dependent synthetase and ligase [Turneriella parva DSM 21527]|uniref:AMP-dependent synthetase and ligase n=2 Tax=Turneriella TaxID=338321 RepID=I4B8S0_TURPD|nr:AMP-dependent synthetase and ligase [Turneriella parva DSM 21527]
MNHNVPEFLNITQECLARHRATDRQDQVAMIFASGDGAAREYSYAELDDLSARFASSLKDRGILPGSRILLRLPNTVAFPIAFFGAMRAGVIPVPTSPMLTAAEVRYLISNSGAAAVVSEEGLWKSIAGEMPSAELGVLYVSGLKTIQGAVDFEGELRAKTPALEIHNSKAGDPAYLVYTSGTTGYPKGVLHAHRALIGRLPASENWFHFTGDDRILHSGKFNWTYVLGTAMMDPLYHGKTVIVYEGENSPEKWLSLIKEFGCNIFIGVPTIFRQILQKTKAAAADVPSLKHCMCAGEHLTDEVLDGWVSRFGFPIYEGLGMSECSYYISQKKGDDIVKNSAGKIQPGHLVQLLDENLQPVAAGEEGMICINRNDPGLFIEYWRAAEQTAAQFKGDWFLTGDYAIQDAKGYIFFLGRRDEIIKSFGYRVSPFEIERVYRDHPALDDIVAFAEHLGPEKTLISMCVQIKPGATFAEEQLLSWGKERLASYKLPKKVYRLDKFPRSANGKVLRSKIPKELGIV